MTRIFKYPLRITDIQTVPMPEGAETLSVQMQNEFPCIWARVDDSHASVERTVVIVGTGHPCPGDDDAHYVGTVQQFGGSLVWHVFIAGEGV